MSLRIRKLRAESLESRQLLHGGGLASAESIGERVDAVIEHYDTNLDGALGEDDELSERVQEKLAEIDANEDGTVTSEELTVYYETQSVSRSLGLGSSHRHLWRGDAEDRIANAISVVDEDGENDIDQTEVSAELWEQLASADTDGSLALTVEELTAFVEATDAAAREAYISGQVERLFERYDADDSLTIAEDEVAAYRWSHLSTADTDGDGSISQDEATTYFSERLAAREAAWAERQAEKEAEEEAEDDTTGEDTTTEDGTDTTDETTADSQRGRHRGRHRGGRGRR